MSENSGFRGYIGSRPLRGTSYPQRIQNLVIRDYAAARAMNYKLSATEYAMAGCYMILHDVLGELPQLEGVILFSVFLLPARRERRLAIYERILDTGRSLHGALEQIAISTQRDVSRFEDVIAVVQALPQTPLGARYRKDGGSLNSADTIFLAAAAQAPGGHT